MSIHTGRTHSELTGNHRGLPLQTIGNLPFVGFKSRCSAAERSVRVRKKGGKLSESREKRDEFLTTPRSYSSRGEPKAKLLGAFSLVRFFGASKEMNNLFDTPQ